KLDPMALFYSGTLAPIYTGIDSQAIRQQTAYDNDIVQRARFRQIGSPSHLDAAACLDKALIRGNHAPLTMDLAAPVGLVRGVPQTVDETGEGDERELRRQDEPNPQVRHDRTISA
ncbi:MAG: hypothetical protein O3A08_12220, partial [Proteobacteria bacterium]|nr:hypothetical protein [Pseudomonadota bacterium]